MRIVGGRWRRTPLAVADRNGLRPTPERVRETVFDWLGHLLGGADGPTAIVCGGSSKEKLHAACSALHFEPVEGDIEWRIVFNIKNSNEMSLELI